MVLLESVHEKYDVNFRRWQFQAQQTSTNVSLNTN
jgi:hypothetical protein